MISDIKKNHNGAWIMIGRWTSISDWSIVQIGLSNHSGIKLKAFTNVRANPDFCSSLSDLKISFASFDFTMNGNGASSRFKKFFDQLKF